MLPLAVIANPASQGSGEFEGRKRDRGRKGSRKSSSLRSPTLPASAESIVLPHLGSLEPRASVSSVDLHPLNHSRNPKHDQPRARSRPRLKQKSKVTLILAARRKKQLKVNAKLGNSFFALQSLNTGPLSISPSSTPISSRSPPSTPDADQNVPSAVINTVDGIKLTTRAPAAADSVFTSSPESSYPQAVRKKHIPIDLSRYGYVAEYNPFAPSDVTKKHCVAPVPDSEIRNSFTTVRHASEVVSDFESSIPDFPLPGFINPHGSTRPRAKSIKLAIENSITDVPDLFENLDRKKTKAISSLSTNISQTFEGSTSLSLPPVNMAQHFQNASDNFTIDMSRNTPSSGQQRYQQETFTNSNQHGHNSQNSQYVSIHQRSDNQNGDSYSNHNHACDGHPGSSRQHLLEESFHRDGPNSATHTPASVASSAGTPSLNLQTAGVSRTSTSATSTLSGLVCNVHRTTGREPHALVGASTTILGDKLYVFGGRRLSRSRPFLTSDLFELDLVRRHWTKLETRGEIPAPRYFHSVCALGDTKLVCYGGMSPQAATPSQHVASQQIKSKEKNGNHGGSISEQQLAVMSDVHIYDIHTHTWMHIPSHDAPQGRYAHCAAILPSSGVFSSPDAPLSAIHHNPSSPQPNHGTIGVALDGHGGAEMIVVGGQDKENHYIEQISVFNLRSLRWTATNTLEKSCGAYRSVVTPLTTMNASDVGAGSTDNRMQRELDGSHRNRQCDDHENENDGSVLIYSNYNFLQVKLELQVRLPDGTLLDKPMRSQQSPPGLRFPNGGVIANHFVVSGTFLTPSEQEYAMWALDLRTLSWSRIDAGGSIFRHGSWNRGLLWNRRNTFIVLGNRKRRLVEDYNHRRINFSNICTVELEAFGLYDNPRRREPTSGYVSSSCAAVTTSLSSLIKSPLPAPPSYALPKTPSSSETAASIGGRHLTRAAQELGDFTLNNREMCDMDFLAIDGQRIPVNSHLIARRWGPYFIHLMREGAAAAAASAAATGQTDGAGYGTDMATLRPSAASQASRNSSVTITQSVKTAYSVATTVTGRSSDANKFSGDFESVAKPGSSSSNTGIASGTSTSDTGPVTTTKDQLMNTYLLPPSTRPRTLYLPHTYLTLCALVTYLYTSSLPSPSSSTLLNYQAASSISSSTMAAISTSQSQLCTPQVLCSLLQIARPYRIDGLLEAVIERLQMVLDGRNTAAIFNAAAMAAGGGDGVGFYSAFGTSCNVQESGVNGFGMADLATLTAHARLAPDDSLGNSNPTENDKNVRGPFRIDTALPREDPTGDGDKSAGGFTTSSSIAQSNYPPSEPGSSSASAVSGLSGSGTLDGDDIIHGAQGRAGITDFGDEEIWSGEISAVVGLQKRGLRGLMEGRRLRERGGSAGSIPGGSAGGLNDGSSLGQIEGSSGGGEAAGIGLGIA